MRAFVVTQKRVIRRAERGLFQPPAYLIRTVPVIYGEHAAGNRVRDLAITLEKLQ